MWQNRCHFSSLLNISPLETGVMCNFSCCEHMWKKSAVVGSVWLWEWKWSIFEKVFSTSWLSWQETSICSAANALVLGLITRAELSCHGLFVTPILTPSSNILQMPSLLFLFKDQNTSMTSPIIPITLWCLSTLFIGCPILLLINGLFCFLVKMAEISHNWRFIAECHILCLFPSYATFSFSSIVCCWYLHLLRFDSWLDWSIKIFECVKHHVTHFSCVQQVAASDTVTFLKLP